MRITLPRTLSALLLVATPLAGCSAPIDPASLADQAALNAREVVHQTGGGVGFTQGDDSGLRKIMNGFGRASDNVSSMMPAPLPPGMASAMNTGPMAMAMAGMPSMQTSEEQFDQTADQLRVWLRQRILADANLESKSDDQATYLLAGDPTCRALPQDGDPPGTVTALDAHCVDQLTRLVVRVVLTADGDGVRLTVLVGPDRLELSAFVIHSDLLAVEVDLAQAYAASQYIDDTLGTDSPMDMTRFEALAGTLRLSLHKDGLSKVTGSLSVLNAIHVATRDSAGSPGPDVTLAASDPTLAVTADGVNQALTSTVDVRAIDVLTDWDPKGIVAANRDLHVAIGGFTGQSTFTENSDAIVSKGFGIGASSVSVRGARIFDLGLNPNDSHRFDATVTLDAAGNTQVAITPRFDLALGFHLGLVASDFSNQPPSYLLDETYRILLDNGGAAASVAAAPATSTYGGGLKVTAGTLTISSTAATTPVIVPAGQCLAGGGTAAPGAHPLLGQLSAVDCNN
jgi:hypothetical protein